MISARHHSVWSSCALLWRHSSSHSPKDRFLSATKRYFMCAHVVGACSSLRCIPRPAFAMHSCAVSHLALSAEQSSFQMTDTHCVLQHFIITKRHDICALAQHRSEDILVCDYIYFWCANCIRQQSPPPSPPPQPSNAEWNNCSQMKINKFVGRRTFSFYFMFFFLPICEYRCRRKKTKSKRKSPPSVSAHGTKWSYFSCQLTTNFVLY